MADKRGGARQGAGRKPFGVIPVSLRIRPEDIEFIRTLSNEMGVTTGEIVHQLVKSFQEQSK